MQRAIMADAHTDVDSCAPLHRLRGLRRMLFGYAVNTSQFGSGDSFDSRTARCRCSAGRCDSHANGPRLEGVDAWDRHATSSAELTSGRALHRMDD